MASTDNLERRYILLPRARHADRPPRGGKTVRARQQAALLALRTAARPEAAGSPSDGGQRPWGLWGRALAEWLELL